MGMLVSAGPSCSLPAAMGAVSDAPTSSLDADTSTASSETSVDSGEPKMLSRPTPCVYGSDHMSRSATIGLKLLHNTKTKKKVTHKQTKDVILATAHRSRYAVPRDTRERPHTCGYPSRQWAAQGYTVGAIAAASFYRLFARAGGIQQHRGRVTNRNRHLVVQVVDLCGRLLEPTPNHTKLRYNHLGYYHVGVWFQLLCQHFKLRSHLLAVGTVGNVCAQVNNGLTDSRESCT